jgi:hypothetical protein
MRITAYVTGGKPTAVCSQSISGVSAIDALVAHGCRYLRHPSEKEGDPIPLFCLGHHTRL